MHVEQRVRCDHSAQSEQRVSGVSLDKQPSLCIIVAICNFLTGWVCILMVFIPPFDQAGSRPVCLI